MRSAWMIFLYAVALIGGIGLIIFTATAASRARAAMTNRTCPANDIIIYVKEPPNENTYFCTVEGQQLTLVRQAGYATYIRCSCSK